jgi:predicted alpha/beta hydrolase family esterase
MSKPLVLILGGWYCKPTDHWYPWLKSELEKKGYKAEIPELLTMDRDYPDLETMFNQVEKLYFDIDELGKSADSKSHQYEKEIILVGHSLGSLLALRLAEKYKINKLILLATWDYDDLTTNHKSFWKSPLNHSLIKQNSKEIHIFITNNDPYFTPFQGQEMTKRLDAHSHFIKNMGHFCKDSDPALENLQKQGFVKSNKSVLKIPKITTIFS